MARRTTNAQPDQSETVQSASALAQIREKELEFDGLVMVARTESERRIRESQEQAADAIRRAEAEAESLVTQQEATAIAAAESEARQALEMADAEVDHLGHLAESRRRATVEAIVDSVMGT